MAQKTCRAERKTFAEAGFALDSPCTGSRRFRQMRFERPRPCRSRRLAACLGGRNVRSILVFCVKASSKALFRKPSSAISSPTAWSRPICWSGPRGWRAGKRRGKSRACSRPAAGPRQSRQPRGARQCRATVAGRSRSRSGLWALLGRSLLFCIGTLLVIPAPWVATVSIAGSFPAARPGAAQSWLHRQRWRHLVRLRSDRAPDLFSALPAVPISHSF